MGGTRAHVTYENMPYLIFYSYIVQFDEERALIRFLWNGDNIYHRAGLHPGVLNAS